MCMLYAIKTFVMQQSVEDILQMLQFSRKDNTCDATNVDSWQ